MKIFKLTFFLLFYVSIGHAGDSELSNIIVDDETCHDIPPEILLHIFSFFKIKNTDAKTITNISLVSKLFHDIAHVLIYDDFEYETCKSYISLEENSSGEINFRSIIVGRSDNLNKFYYLRQSFVENLFDQRIIFIDSCQFRSKLLVSITFINLKGFISFPILFDEIQNIQTIKIINCPDLVDLTSLNQCQNLKKLVIKEIKLKDIIFPLDFESFGELTSLTIDGKYDRTAIDSTNSGMTNFIEGIILSCPNLENIWLTGFYCIEKKVLYNYKKDRENSHSYFKKLNIITGQGCQESVM